MMLARKTLRPLGIALLIMTLILSVGSLALAEDDPISFTIQVSPDSLTGPGEVNVSLRVSNSGEKDMVDPVTLYDPAGNVVPSFGDGGSYILKSGDSLPWEGVWNVTQAELDAGEFAYTLKYQMQDESGAMVSFQRQALGRVQYAGEHAALSVTRTISPEVVRSSGTATVTYELYNSGNVALKDIRVKEHISKNAQTVKTLAAGERTTLKFTSKIGNADLVSNAEITYKAEGGTKTLTEKVDDATIPLAKPGLEITLSSDTTGVNIGEAAKLIITFTNKGNVSYSNVTVTEAKKGEILTNLSIPAGATVVEEKEFILTEPTTFKVKATLPDNTGETQTLSSKNELKLGVYDPDKVILLTLNLTVEPETVAKAPANVRFHLTVTNNSNVKAENIAITHGEKPIYTIAALEPGASVTLDRDVTISQAGNYRFTASLKDSLNNTVTFDSETVRIAYAQPTAAPTTAPRIEVTPQASLTPAPVDPLLTQGEDILKIAGLVLAGLFACTLLLFIISSIMRIHNRSKSKAAYDHLELAERRDYTEPAEDDGEPDLPMDEDADLSDVEPLPHEKLIQDAARQAENAAAPEDLPAGDGEGGYRISRADQPQPQVQPVREDSPEEGESQAAEGRRRHRRAKRNEDGE